MFSGCTVPPDSKETEFGSSETKRLLHQQVKYRGSFSAMSRMEVCPYNYFWWCGYFRGPGVSFVTKHEFSVRVTNITSRIGVSWTQSHLSVFKKFLTQWIMALLSKGCIPDKFEAHISLKFCFNLVPILLNVNISLNQILQTFLLCVRQTWMIQLILAIWGFIFL